MPGLGKPTKRCRAKVSPSQATLKSPDPKKLRKAAKAMKSPSPSSGAFTPEPILKRGPSTEAIAKKLSFASPRVIQAESKAPKKGSSEARV